MNWYGFELLGRKDLLLRIANTVIQGALNEAHSGFTYRYGVYGFYVCQRIYPRTHIGLLRGNGLPNYFLKLSEERPRRALSEC